MSIISHSITIKLQERLDRYSECEQKTSSPGEIPGSSSSELITVPKYNLFVRGAATFTRQVVTPFLALIETVVRLALVIPILLLSIFFICHSHVRKVDLALIKGVGRSLYAVISPARQSIQESSGLGFRPYLINGKQVHAMNGHSLLKGDDGLLYTHDLDDNSDHPHYQKVPYTIQKAIWKGKTLVEIT